MSSKIRLYFSKELKANLLSNLSTEQSHYIKNVMRLKPGDTISLFNSTNGEWSAKIVNHNKENTEFKVEKLSRPQEEQNNLWLAFSPIKSNYFNFMIQKATELGVTKFIPIIFDRTIVRKINKERLEKIIIEATEQSNRINVPVLEKPQNLKNFLNKYTNKVDLIFADLNTSKTKLEINKKASKPLCVIIGPEGDFSENEREQILNFEGVRPIKINENILRAETATISVISIINYILNL